MTFSPAKPMNSLLMIDPAIAQALTEHAEACARLGCTYPVDPVKILSGPVAAGVLGFLFVASGLSGRIFGWLATRLHRAWLAIPAQAALLAVLWLLFNVLLNLAWGKAPIPANGPVINLPGQTTGLTLSLIVDRILTIVSPVFFGGIALLTVLSVLKRHLTPVRLAALATLLVLAQSTYSFAKNDLSNESFPIPAESLRDELAHMAAPFGVAPDELRVSIFAVGPNGATASNLLRPRIVYAHNLFYPLARISQGKHDVKSLDERQIKAVTGHELAHIDLNHSWKLIGFIALFGGMLFAVSFLVLGWLADRRRGRWHLSGATDPALLPAYFAALSAANIVFGFGYNALSRQYEAEADRRGIEISGDPVGFALALIRVDTGRHLASPSLLAEWLSTHPASQDRIAVTALLVPKPLPAPQTPAAPIPAR